MRDANDGKGVGEDKDRDSHIVIYPLRQQSPLRIERHVWK